MPLPPSLAGARGRTEPRHGGSRWPATFAAGLAVDLDRTLVHSNRRPPRAATLALHEARAMGLKLILVSGRVHSALAPFVRALGEFDGVVGENGAVIEVPVGRPPLVLGARIAGQVRRRLRSDPDLRVEYGRVVTSVRRVDGPRAMDLVQGLPVSVIENVDRVMILPRGITKATGVHLALERLGLAGRGFAAIGDGENDVPMLREAALSGAVANATPSARSAASYRCKAPSASGVAEFVRGPLTDWRIEAAGGETRSR